MWKEDISKAHKGNVGKADNQNKIKDSQRIIKVVVFTIRGLNTPNKIYLLKHNLTTFELETLLIQESKLNREEKEN